MLIPTCFSSAMVCCRDCLGGVVVVAVVSLSAVGASMSEKPSDSLSASQPASPGVRFNKDFRDFPKPVPNHIWSFETYLNFLFPGTVVVLKLVSKSQYIS